MQEALTTPHLFAVKLTTLLIVTVLLFVQAYPFQSQAWQSEDDMVERLKTERGMVSATAQSRFIL